MVHHGIICDGCDQNGVQGVRFKCLVCPDYDLCATCEGKRIHDEHPMIRVPKPDDKTWVPAFMASQGINRFAFRGGRHGHCPYFGGRGQGRGHCHQTGDRSEQQQSQEQQHQQGAQEIPGAQFLRDVGQAVASVLNGFGIDVDVDVEQDGQRTKVAAPKNKQEEKTEEKKQEEKVEEKKQDAGTNVSMDQPMQNINSPPAAEAMETGVNTPEGQQDWTILDSAEATAPGSIPAATASASIAPSSNPRVADAVQQMMAMGFTNEGGWLTQLLEAKDGDIMSVLEILHPSGKP